MATDFVIFDENKTTADGIPYFWGGRYGWTGEPCLAHVYKDHAAVSRALKRNGALKRGGVFYLTADEIHERYNIRLW